MTNSDSELAECPWCGLDPDLAGWIEAEENQSKTVEEELKEY